MYQTHCLDIALACKNDERVYRRMLQFVIFSIRTKFYLLEEQMEDYIINGVHAKSVWGFKQKALDEIQLITPKSDFKSATEATMYFKNITGFGNAKAGFAAQMLGYNVACLDTHNLKRLGIRDVRTMSTESYVELTQQTGGAEYWWNTWCDLIAKKYPKHFDDAYDVSAYHYCRIVGDY